MLEILKHSGPARLGILHMENKKIPTPNIVPEELLKEESCLCFGYDIPREIAEFSVKLGLGIPTIYGSKYLDLRLRCAEALKDKPLLKIANGEKLLQNPRFLVELIEKLREIVSPNTALYFPFASPHQFYILAYLGIDLFDTAQGLLLAQRGFIQTTRGVYNLKNIKELPCSCSICSKSSVEDLLKNKKLAAQHNINIAMQVLKEIRNAIRSNELRELVEEKASCEVNLMVMLRSISYNYAEKYTLIMP